MFFWPSFNLFIWGYTATFLVKERALSPVGFFLISACILWIIILRAQQEISSPILEKISDSQLKNFFIAPMDKFDYIIAITGAGLVKNILSLLPVFMIGIVLFASNFFKLGWIIFILIINLYFFGWLVGIFLLSFALALGRKIAFLDVPTSFIITPFSCVFYSRDTLPSFLKFFSWLVPPSYIFETLREIIFNGSFNYKYILISIILNFVYFIVALLLFSFMFKIGLKKGVLARS
jgi:ABC-2 type transport system permease protein